MNMNNLATCPGKLVTRRIGKFVIARVNGRVEITRDGCTGMCPAKTWAAAVAYAMWQTK
jgi:hypothetical protein